MTADYPGVAAPKDKASSRVVVLDGLRLVAATMVVLYHYVGVPRSKIGHGGTTEVLAWGTSASQVFAHPLNELAGFGWTGVELFFMISGFVICMSGWGRKPADFFISRVVRLVPAYWAAIVLTGAVLLVFPRLTAGIRPGTVLSNLSMVQAAYGVPNLNPAFWTLLIELKFYLLFGLVALGGVNYRRMVTFCVLWSVGSIAAVGSHDAVLNLVMSPRYSAYFIAGIAFFLIHRFGSNLLLWGIVAYSWRLTLDNPRVHPRWEVTVLLTSFFVIMALVATHKLDRIRWRWLTVAGALTYPLYLVHQDIGFTVFAYLHSYFPAPALAAATYVAMLALAWLIHRVVERPIGPRLRAALAGAVDSVRRSGAPAPAPAAPAPPAAAAAAAAAAEPARPPVPVRPVAPHGPVRRARIAGRTWSPASYSQGASAESGKPTLARAEHLPRP